MILIKKYKNHKNNKIKPHKFFNQNQIINHNKIQSRIKSKK